MNSQTGPIPALMILLLITSGVSAVVATEKISEQEEIECQICHADPDQNAETLTDQGLYFEYMRTLTGYDQVLQRFDSCTYCHVQVTGAKALTARGYRFRWMMEDMVGLRAWLEENHPSPDKEDESAGDSE